MSRPKIRFNSFLDDEFWDEVKLGDVARVIMGQSPSASSYNDNGSGLPLIQGNADIQSGRTFHTKYTSSPTKICKKGDVILTVRAPVGEMAFASKRCCLGRGVCAITERGNDSNLSFLFYAINAHKEQWKKLEQGSTFTAVNSNDVNNFKIAMPGLKEQQKVASFFSTLDEKISLSKRKLEALERLKKGLMQNIFTQQIRFKDECAKEFPTWRKISLGEIVRFKNGINAKKNSFGSGIKLISVSDVLSKNPIAYDSISLSVEVEERIKKDFAVTYGDILFQRSSETVADAGTSNVYLDKAKDAVFGGFVICGKKIADYDPIFVNEALRTYPVRKQIMRLAQGAQHINIGQEALSKVTIDWPCLQEQKKIANLVKEIDERIRLVGEKTEALKTLKQGFMQQMFV